MWLQSCDSSTKMRWPKMTSFACLVVGAGCQPDLYFMWSVLLKEYLGFFTYQSHGSKKARVAASRLLEAWTQYSHTITSTSFY